MKQLERFLSEVLPNEIEPSTQEHYEHVTTKNQFIKESSQGLELAAMALRLTPNTLSCIDWARPMDDPVRRQFLPLKSDFMPNHPKGTLDSLNEKADSR
jgi:lysine 2,3-aminomutase